MNPTGAFLFLAAGRSSIPGPFLQKMIFAPQSS
jgi:hypothetical protein